MCACIHMCMWSPEAGIKDLPHSQAWQHMSLVLALGRQRQEDRYDFEASLVFKVSSRTVRLEHRETCLEKKNKGFF